MVSPVWAVAAAFVIFAWLLVLTVLTLRQQGSLKTLFPKDGSRDIRNKFKELIEIVAGFARNNEVLERRILEFKKEGLANFSKLAVLKYNPYNDTGGDQSFSLAILDGKMDGVVITSLHARSGTRIYLKNIKKGKSELELSKEESKVLKDALDS